jgi:hypothetical protein
LVREAHAQAEAAREAEAVRLVQEAFQVQAAAEAVRREATALAGQLLLGVCGETVFIASLVVLFPRCLDMYCHCSHA